MKQYKLTYSVGGNIISNISLPASKSIANRALIIAALCGAENNIKNLSDCDDTKAVIRALNSDDEIKDIGAAGTAMRFLTAYYAISNTQVEMTGTERMKNRPISILVDALNTLGANIEYLEKSGFPPLKIIGRKLKGGEIHVNGSVSSQYLSALLMVSPYTEDGVKLVIEGDLVSKPYLEMTLSLMKTYGVNYKWENNVIEILSSEYKPIDFIVENDWSAASYWYSILCILANDTPKCIFNLKFLNKNSLQGDSHLKELYEPLGINTEFTDNGIRLSVMPDVKLPSVYDISLKDQPDLAQTLVVSCILMDVPFKFSGLETLKIKETDRINALITECKKLGFILYELSPGVLCWDGEKCLPDSEIVIDTYEDHRMAMAFSPAVIKYKNLFVNNPDVVSKSYPNYWEEFKKVLSCDIDIIN